MLKEFDKEKLLKCFLLLFCIYLAGLVFIKFGAQPLSDLICMSVVFAFFMLPVSFIPLFIMEIGVYVSSDSFGRLLKVSEKNLLTYPFAKKIYFRNFYYWFLAYCTSFCMTVDKNSRDSGALGALFASAILFYPCCALYSHLKKDLKPYENQTLSSSAEPFSGAEKQARPEPIVSLDIENLEIITAKLKKISGQLEDKDLIAEIGQITRTLKKTKEFICETRDDACSEKCLRQVLSYAEELYEMLVKYDNVENSRLRTGEVVNTMNSIHEFTKEMNGVFQKIFESAVAPKLLKSKSRVDALRDEIRLKGLGSK